MAKAAQGACLFVGSQDALAKRALVESPPHHGCDVGPARLRIFGDGHWTLAGVFRCPLGEAGVVDGNSERQASRIIAHDERGPACEVSPWHQTMEVDERRPPSHRFPQADIVMMIWIIPAILVREKAIFPEPIVIRSPRGSRRDGEGHARENLGFEDPLGPDEWYAYSLEFEPPSQQVPGEHVSQHLDVLSQPVEGGNSDFCVSDGPIVSVQSSSGRLRFVSL